MQFPVAQCDDGYIDIVAQERVRQGCSTYTPSRTNVVVLDISLTVAQRDGWRC